LSVRTDNRTETGQTIEQKQDRQYSRNRTDKRTETGQKIEQKQDNINRTDNRIETVETI
jgi:hypothetical protein